MRFGRALAITCLLLTALPRTALGGGMGRPNAFGPAALGIGGAGFAGVPNPTTIHYNPAGLVLSRTTNVMAGFELINSVRSYEPLVGATENNIDGWTPGGSFGMSTRFASRGGQRPARFAVGLAVYNTYGGFVSFDEEEVAQGLIDTLFLQLEFVPTAAYQVTSDLAIGLGIRIGYCFFDLKTNEFAPPDLLPAKLSGAGVNVGVSLGATYQALSWLRIGLVYSSPLEVDMKGDGEVQATNGSWNQDNVSWVVPWPQWAALGIALEPVPSLSIYSGIRWIDWSSFDAIVLKMGKNPDVTTGIDFTDGISIHLGADWRLHDRVAVRGGVSYDSDTAPERNIEREYLDMPKITAAIGASVQITSFLAIDVVYEAMMGFPRTVPDRRLPTVNPSNGSLSAAPVNASPGRYTWMMHSIGLGARYRY